MSKSTIEKVNYFYIDESGGILNDSDAFILGCIRTDTPELMKQKTDALLKGFEDDIYYSSMIEDIKQQGFHAVDNHPDVRAEFFSILPLLNFRAFLCIINKKKSPYKELIAAGEEKKIYVAALDKILKGRLNNRHEQNVFAFEELQFKESTQQKILDEYFGQYMKAGNVSYTIIGKENVNLATVDYVNYIFQVILKTSLDKTQRMVDNFELIKPKIALINILHSDSFLTRHSNFDAAKVVQLYSG